MSRPMYVASCSGGKDSVATLLLAAQHNEPLDEAVFSEVMFDHALSGEVPEHRDFIYDRLKPYCENQLGIKFTVLRADKTYDDVFHHIIVRGPNKGQKRGFVWPGMCAVNRDCKVPPIRKYNAALSPDIKQDHPDALVCFAQHDYFELYGDDAKKAAPLLSTKLLDKKIRGQPPLPVTGFKQELWVAASKKLWKAGHDVLLVKDGEVFKDLKAADFIPVGAELHIDGILSRVEKVDFQAGRVALANIERRDHPVPYSESLDYVRSCVEDTGLAIYEAPRKQRKEASRSSVRDKLKTVRKEATAQTRSPVKVKGKEREL